MTQHLLQGRTEAELLWFQRRGFLRAAAAWTAAGGFGAALAQQRSNIVALQGDATVNGARATPQSVIQTGDAIETGPGSNLVFVIGTAAFQVRQNTRLMVERGNSLNAVSLLRLLTGGVASVWGKGLRRQIVTPTLTAGIRGTGVYTEVPPQQGRTYFCNCYGEVDVIAGGERTLSKAVYHESFWAWGEPEGGRLLWSAPAINHTDEEMEQLARLVGQRTAWQVSGQRGDKDAGYGDRPATAPAAPAPSPR